MGGNGKCLDPSIWTRGQSKMKPISRFLVTHEEHPDNTTQHNTSLAQKSLIEKKMRKWEIWAALATRWRGPISLSPSRMLRISYTFAWNVLGFLFWEPRGQDLRGSTPGMAPRGGPRKLLGGGAAPTSHALHWAPPRPPLPVLPPLSLMDVNFGRFLNYFLS